jgi:flagellar biosynthesis chaperone FliJ
MKINETLITDEMRQDYKELVDKIGIGAVTLIHFIHYEEFLAQLDIIKKQNRRELLKEIIDHCEKNYNMDPNNRDILLYKYVYNLYLESMKDHK